MEVNCLYVKLISVVSRDSKKKMFVNRSGHHKAVVVIGMLSYQVDAPRSPHYHGCVMILVFE